MPLIVATAMIVTHEGIFGIVSNAENLSVVGALPYLAIKALRRCRHISTPHRKPRSQRRQGRKDPRGPRVKR
jgi:hypothetical protein